MHDVFISYSSKNKTIADTICHYFESKGIKCWYAPRDIPPGEQWTEALVEAIQNARCFLLVYSKESNQSRQVLNEITTAFNASCPIVPFRIDDVGMTPAVSYYLNSVHWLDAMTPPLENHLPVLYETVCRVLNVEQKAEVETDRHSIPVLDWFKKKKVYHSEKKLRKKKSEKKKSGKKWKFIIIAFLIIMFIRNCGKDQKTNSDVQNMSQTILFEDISSLERYTYPFYGLKMFSANRDMYFVQDRETGSLSLIKTDTKYPLIEDFAYFPEKPDSVYVELFDDYNIIYFFEQNQNIVTIRLYDKKKHTWVSEDGISLEFSETESIYVELVNVEYMTSGEDYLDQMCLLIYDSDSDRQCITKAICVYSNEEYDEYDISQYKFTSYVSGIDKPGEHCVLLLTDNNEIKVFDTVTMEALELSMQQIQEMYLPYAANENNFLSKNGSYLYLSEYMADSVSKLTVWDLTKQKSVYGENFAENYSVCFQGDSTLLIFNVEDTSLRSYDLKSERKTLLLDESYFMDEAAFSALPYAFCYSEELNACIFVASGYDDVAQSYGVKVIMTALDGTVLAESAILKHDFESYYLTVDISDGLLILAIEPSDSTLEYEDGINTHIFRARYSVDENGAVEFY